MIPEGDAARISIGGRSYAIKHAPLSFDQTSPQMLVPETAEERIALLSCVLTSSVTFEIEFISRPYLGPDIQTRGDVSLGKVIIATVVHLLLPYTGAPWLMTDPGDALVAVMPPAPVTIMGFCTYALPVL